MRVQTVELISEIFLNLFIGVHGGVKAFYKVEPEVEHPSTLDHIVASAGG
jgi:hypothetical protein